MEENVDHYRQLLQRYLDNDCTPQQVEEVMQYLQQDASARVLLEQMQTAFEKAMELQDPAVPAAISEHLYRRLSESIPPPPRRPFYRTLLFRVAAAALLLVLLGAGMYFLFFDNQSVKPAAGDITATRVIPATLPGRNKAYITMADGKEMLLDNASGGILAREGHTQIIQPANGQVAYQSDSSLTTDYSPLTYNTLTVPRGGAMVALTLADGTRVWVNTASSLRYPTVFTGKDRMVELTGEAYFEVKHDQVKPFLVSTNQVTVHVLGTVFNVSAYQDDEQQQVVLVNGSVKLSGNVRSERSDVKVKGSSPLTSHFSRVLSPGQLASFVPGTDQLSIATVNTEEYTSWTKGYLLLKHTPWEQIIRKLSRHYDVTIHTNVPAFKEETFSGRLDLHANLEDMMNLVCTGTPFVYLPKERKLIHR